MRRGGMSTEKVRRGEASPAPEMLCSLLQATNKQCTHTHTHTDTYTYTLARTHGSIDPACVCACVGVRERNCVTERARGRESEKDRYYLKNKSGVGWGGAHSTRWRLQNE